MCKGCTLDDTVAYLDDYVSHFERAASDVATARKWLVRTAHTTKNQDKKHHLNDTAKRLHAVARELSSIRDEFLSPPKET